jgi:cytochrome b-561
VALVWAGIFLNPLVPLFSPHPLLQSAGVFVLVQAILILQPTWTPEAKTQGARVHAALHLLSFLIFAAGVTIIEVNKGTNPKAHFHSVHAYLGIVTTVLLFGQYVFGLLMWGFPQVFGGVDNAKRFYRYHRWGGYTLFILVLATVASATHTDYNKNVLDIKLWSVLVAEILILVGILPRASLQKLGLRS